MARQSTDIQRLRARLLDKGMTVADFSRMYGWKVGTVRKNIRRHYGRGTRPWGTVSREILKRLKEHIA